MNPLLLTLNLIRDIALYTTETTEALCDEYGISDRTFKRHIEEARHLGADLQAVKTGKHWVWVCNNWSDIEQRVNTWHELETQRDLTGPLST